MKTSMLQNSNSSHRLIIKMITKISFVTEQKIINNF